MKTKIITIATIGVLVFLLSSCVTPLYSDCKNYWECVHREQRMKRERELREVIRQFERKYQSFKKKKYGVFRLRQILCKKEGVCDGF